MDLLSNHLSPLAIARLEERACKSRQARIYLVLLHLAAFLLAQAQGMESDSPSQIDQAVTATARDVERMFPEHYEGIHAVLIHLTGDVALDYFKQRARITQGGKTALLLRLRGKKVRG